MPSTHYRLLVGSICCLGLVIGIAIGAQWLAHHGFRKRRFPLKARFIAQAFQRLDAHIQQHETLFLFPHHDRPDALQWLYLSLVTPAQAGVMTRAVHQAYIQGGYQAELSVLNSMIYYIAAQQHLQYIRKGRRQPVHPARFVAVDYPTAAEWQELVAQDRPRAFRLLAAMQHQQAMFGMDAPPALVVSLNQFPMMADQPGG